LGHYRKGIAEEAIDQHEAANSSFEKAFKCGELYPWIEPVDLMRVSTACSRTAIRIGNYEAAWKVCLFCLVKLHQSNQLIERSIGGSEDG